MWLSYPIVFRYWNDGITSVGLPHSAIRGSQDMCSYPRLFAAYHGLLRLVAPRHPPYTYCSLDHIIVSSQYRFQSTPGLPRVSLIKRRAWSSFHEQGEPSAHCEPLVRFASFVRYQEYSYLHHNIASLEASLRSLPLLCHRSLRSSDLRPPTARRNYVVISSCVFNGHVTSLSWA